MGELQLVEFVDDGIEAYVSGEIAPSPRVRILDVRIEARVVRHDPGAPRAPDRGRWSVRPIRVLEIPKVVVARLIRSRVEVPTGELLILRPSGVDAVNEVDELVGEPDVSGRRVDRAGGLPPAGALLCDHVVSILRVVLFRSLRICDVAGPRLIQDCQSSDQRRRLFPAVKV